MGEYTFSIMEAKCYPGRSHSIDIFYYVKGTAIQII